MLACRSAKAAHEEKKKIMDAETGGYPVVIGALDLESMDSIQDFATVFRSSHHRLDILVNNAGCNFVSEWRTEKGVPGIVQASAHLPFLPVSACVYKLCAKVHAYISQNMDLFLCLGEFPWSTIFDKAAGDAVGTMSGTRRQRVFGDASAFHHP